MKVVSYVTCPECGVPFTEPLLPAGTSYRVVLTHPGQWGGTCRVVVAVHPNGRTEAEVVPPLLSLEEALYESNEEGHRAVAWWVI